MSRKEKEAIRALRSFDDITITKSDKGEEMDITRTSKLEELCMEHLSDTNTYGKLKKDPTNNIRIRITRPSNASSTIATFQPA